MRDSFDELAPLLFIRARLSTEMEGRCSEIHGIRLWSGRLGSLSVIGSCCYERKVSSSLEKTKYFSKLSISEFA